MAASMMNSCFGTSEMEKLYEMCDVNTFLSSIPKYGRLKRYNNMNVNKRQTRRI